MTEANDSQLFEIRLHTPSGSRVSARLVHLGMSEILVTCLNAELASHAVVGTDLEVHLRFPSKRSLRLSGRLSELVPGMDSEHTQILVTLNSCLETSGLRPQPERRVKGRINLRNAMKPVCVAPHPLLPGLTMAFKVLDVSSTGLRMGCLDSYPTLVPGMVIDADLFLSQATKPHAVRLAVRRVLPGSEVQSHVLGVVFVEPSRRLLDGIARHLLKEEQSSPDELLGAGLHRCSKALEHAGFPALAEVGVLTGPVGAKEGDESFAASVRVIQSLDHWLEVLRLRQAAIRQNALAEAAHSDVRLVQEPIDALATHHGVWGHNGQLLGSVALLPLQQQTERGRQALRSVLNLGAADALPLLEFTQYCVHESVKAEDVVDLLLAHALEHSKTYYLGDLVVYADPFWLQVIQKTQRIPSRMMRLPERGLSLMVFRVDDEGGFSRRRTA